MIRPQKLRLAEDLRLERPGQQRIGDTRHIIQDHITRPDLHIQLIPILRDRLVIRCHRSEIIHPVDIRRTPAGITIVRTDISVDKIVPVIIPVGTIGHQRISPRDSRLRIRSALEIPGRDGILRRLVQKAFLTAPKSQKPQNSNKQRYMSFKHNSKFYNDTLSPKVIDLYCGYVPWSNPCCVARLAIVLEFTTLEVVVTFSSGE